MGLAVGLIVAVELSLFVIEPVPLSVPVFKELAPTESEAVGVPDVDFERLVVDDGVIEEVDVPLLVAVGLIVAVELSLFVIEPVPLSEPEVDALAPTESEAVGVGVGVPVFDIERLSVKLNVGVSDDMPVLLGLPPKVFVVDGDVLNIVDSLSLPEDI